MADAIKKGYIKLLLHIVDTDVTVLAIATIYIKADKLRMVFGTSGYLQSKK